MSTFAKRYHPPGTAPGTLVASDSPVPLSLRLISYTNTQYSERMLSDPIDSVPLLDAEATIWIDVQGNVPPAVLHQLGQRLNLHALALEDVLNTGQQAKLEDYDEQLFVVMHCPSLDASGVLQLDQVSFFLAPGVLVSFYGQAQDLFGSVRERLRQHHGRLRQHGSDYLLYRLLDLVVDHGFPVLEHYGERLEALEDEVLAQPTQPTLAKVHRIRRELLWLRRLAWPQREVLSQLFRGDCACIAPETRLFLRDSHDHTIQILDLVESDREMIASLLEVYLSSVSNRLNESMRLLTIMATLFIPLTFVAGVYGMNFGNNTQSAWAMPELRWDYGYPMIWGVMIAIAAGMLYLFKRNKWL
jgi:magnesium transporter